jgi:hypothetical protein
MTRTKPIRQRNEMDRWKCCCNASLRLFKSINIMEQKMELI